MSYKYAYLHIGEDQVLEIFGDSMKIYQRVFSCRRNQTNIYSMLYFFHLFIYLFIFCQFIIVLARNDKSRHAILPFFFFSIPS